MWWRRVAVAAVLRPGRRQLGTAEAGPARRQLGTAEAGPARRPHLPVMAAEMCSMLQLLPGSTVVDMTFGAGGHTEKLLESTPDLTVYALDRDPSAHARAQRLSDEWRGSGRVVPLLGRFSELPLLLQQAGVSAGSVDAILADCGCCSSQLEDASRGFSLARDGPLDMRMDATRHPDQVTAAQLLAHASEEALARIIRTYGEEPMGRRIARAIVEARYLLRPLRTTHDLAQLVRAVCERQDRDSVGRPAHVATRTFQALRIFVNDELNELAFGCAAAHGLLRPAGRLAVISFHSLEDRIVKEQLLSSALTESEAGRHRVGRNGAALAVGIAARVRDVVRKRWHPVNRKVVVPSDQEVADNPRSRSAKLRVAERCADEQEIRPADGVL